MTKEPESEQNLLEVLYSRIEPVRTRKDPTDLMDQLFHFADGQTEAPKTMQVTYSLSIQFSACS